MAGLDNDFVADTLKVMAVGRDGGRSGWISRGYDRQAGPSAALVMASPQTAAMGVDGATPSADAVNIAISREP